MSRVRNIVARDWTDDNGGYWTYWAGSVPPDGERYFVLDAEWGHEDGCPDPVRYIHEWELARGSQGQGPRPVSAAD